MDRYRSESKLKVTWKFRDSSHVDEATLAYFGAFLLFRFLARYPLPGPLPLAVLYGCRGEKYTHASITKGTVKGMRP
jgi:hypothetical protein